MQFNFGDKVRDVMTGFEGIVYAKSNYFNGCHRIGLQGQKLKEDGGIGDLEWLDEAQCEMIERGCVKLPGTVGHRDKAKKPDAPGGPMPTPPQA